MVLDGAVDPSLDSVEQALIQAEGFEVALRAYVENCVEDGDCYLGGSVDEGVRTIRELLDRVDADPIPGDSERALTEGWAILGIWAPLYAEQNWPLLDAALSQALDGNGRTLMAFADPYVSRGPKGYVDNSVGGALRGELPRPRRRAPAEGGAPAGAGLRGGVADVRPHLRVRAQLRAVRGRCTPARAR